MLSLGDASKQQPEQHESKQSVLSLFYPEQFFFPPSRGVFRKVIYFDVVHQ